MKDNECCDGGMLSEVIVYKKMRVHHFDGHGVGIWDKESNGYFEIGCIDTDSDTCVGTSGGYFIQPDDVIVHTPQTCRDGLRRYST